MNNFLFTSESVSEGHPDKIADQIADAILDSILKQDKKARVGCEVVVKTGIVFVSGEIKTFAKFNLEDIVRKVINDIGYNNDSFGFNGNTCTIVNSIGRQSLEISKGIDHSDLFQQGASDQGLMFGYAVNETTSFMPAPIYYSHKLMQKTQLSKKEKILPWLLPDAKSQVTIRYHDSIPVELDTVVISSQHDSGISKKDIEESIIQKIILPIFPKEWISRNTRYFINPTGSFIKGGPASDCGLTGRKIIVDTYGGYAKHGGGAFSGKDPLKIDRSAAYMCRYLAKNIVSSNLANKCEIQISYAIGLPYPISFMVNTFNSGKVSDANIQEFILKKFDLRPYAIAQYLDLLRPIYQKTSNYGHFGRNDKDFTWEKLDKTIFNDLHS